MDAEDDPEEYPEAIWNWINSSIQFAHNYFAQRTREYCSWSHGAGDFHICACRKHFNGRGFPESKKCSKEKPLREDYFISHARTGKYLISSEAVVGAMRDRAARTRHLAWYEAQLRPRFETHGSLSNGGGSQTSDIKSLKDSNEKNVGSSYNQSMVKIEIPNDATYTPVKTEEEIDLSHIENITIRANWDFEAALRPRNAGSFSNNRKEVLTNKNRRLDIRGDGEVTRLGAGESYRPNHNRRSPPRADTFRSDRDRDRSPRRDRRTPPLSSDSYHPSARDRSPRRRSRTPPYRARDRSPPRDMTWRGRPRSPLRGGRTPIRARTPRRFSPRRDDDRRDRLRSPRRDERRRSRSPFDRNRTPLRPRSPIRTRSPLARRSPPPGPRGGSWRRSRSRDPRDVRTPLGPSSQTWRRRSPSPPIRRRSPSPIRRRSPSPALRDSERSSGRSSGTNSRRSSPPVHPSRQALTQAATREAIRSPVPVRDRSPSGLAYRQVKQERSASKDRSPIRPTAPRSPPRGPAATFRAPTGPSGGRNFAAPIPSGPSSNYNSRSNSTSEGNGHIAPPSGPRGYAPPRGPSASLRGGRPSFSTERHSRPDTSSWGAAPPARPSTDLNSRTNLPPPRPPPSVSPSPARETPPAAPTGPSGIPTGPRAGTSVSSRPSLQHSSSIYHSRGSISGPSSGPRIHPAMVGIPPIIPGGRIDPAASGIPTDLAARLKKKEEEADILREEVQQKQEKLRKGLKHWDRLSRESASMGLKSELSETHLRILAGEGVGGKAF
ncbi:uncharacterized protein EAE98_007466 [Botrytis deweyae]|uniref:Uncharacterized protein n=1 Tax=Botrytis deweyae TaxID=2478750 RepID=A0ABQ7IHN4_9HELO|nr:uncharacterized protein EAE98_007466 [Botrytis deweyae]KAF7924415.1 hypothetical protein EAE98_007466 [Botrytis deweyae]